MDSNPTESWINTLGETELRRLANAFNINAAGVVLILRDRVVRYIKGVSSSVSLKKSIFFRCFNRYNYYLRIFLYGPGIAD